MKNFLLLVAIAAIGQLFPTQVFGQTPTDKQIQAIEKYMAPIRKKLNDVLEADKTGQYQNYLNDLNALAKELDVYQRDELVRQMERDHLTFIRAAYRQVVVNHEEMRRELIRILGHSQFSLGEFGDIQIDFNPPKLVPPLRFDGEINCPLEIKESSSNNQVVADCSARAGSCTMSAQSIAEAVGGCRSKASLGDKLELTGGTFNKVTAVLQSDFEYKGFAVAIGGYGQINAKFGLRIKGPGLDKLVLTKEVYALAPIVWLTRLEGSASNFVSQATVTGNFPEGTAITVQAYIESFALSVPLASLTLINAKTTNIDSIQISASN